MAIIYTLNTDTYIITQYIHSYNEIMHQVHVSLDVNTQNNKIKRIKIGIIGIIIIMIRRIMGKFFETC